MGVRLGLWADEAIFRLFENTMISYFTVQDEHDRHNDGGKLHLFCATLDTVQTVKLWSFRWARHLFGMEGGVNSI